MSNIRVFPSKGRKAGYEVWNGSTFCGHFKDSRLAWKLADKLMGEYQSRREETVDWAARKSAAEGR